MSHKGQSRAFFSAWGGEWLCHDIIHIPSYPFNVYNSVVPRIFTDTFDHHYNLFQNIFITPKANPVHFSSHPSPLSYPLNPRKPLLYLCVDVPIQVLSWKRNPIVHGFCVCLLSLSTMVQGSSVQCALVSHSFHWYIRFYCILYHRSLIHASVDGHLGCFIFWL